MPAQSCPIILYKGRKCVTNKKRFDKKLFKTCLKSPKSIMIDVFNVLHIQKFLFRTLVRSEQRVKSYIIMKYIISGAKISEIVMILK